MIGTASAAWRLYRGAVALRASAGAFAAAPSAQTAWNLGGSVVGVVGQDKVINAMIRFSERLAVGAAGLDASAADEMISLMQARAPRDTGTLHDGIEKFPGDGTWTVRATAQKWANTADYARMVEFGTRAGERGRRVASDDYFSGPYAGRRGSLNEESGRRRRVADARRRINRTHPGTEAQPFFVPSVREVLEARGQALDGLSDGIAQSEDLL